MASGWHSSDLILVWRGLPHLAYSDLEWWGFCVAAQDLQDLQEIRSEKRWSRLGSGHLKEPVLPPQVIGNSLPALREALSLSAAETVAGLDQA